MIGIIVGVISLSALVCILVVAIPICYLKIKKKKWFRVPGGDEFRERTEARMEQQSEERGSSN